MATGAWPDAEVSEEPFTPPAPSAARPRGKATPRLDPSTSSQAPETVALLSLAAPIPPAQPSVAPVPILPALDSVEARSEDAEPVPQTTQPLSENLPLADADRLGVLLAEPEAHFEFAQSKNAGIEATGDDELDHLAPVAKDTGEESKDRIPQVSAVPPPAPAVGAALPVPLEAPRPAVLAQLPPAKPDSRTSDVPSANALPAPAPAASAREAQAGLEEPPSLRQPSLRLENTQPKSTLAFGVVLHPPNGPEQGQPNEQHTAVVPNDASAAPRAPRPEDASEALRHEPPPQANALPEGNADPQPDFSRDSQPQAQAVALTERRQEPATAAIEFSTAGLPWAPASSPAAGGESSPGPLPGVWSQLDAGAVSPQAIDPAPAPSPLTRLELRTTESATGEARPVSVHVEDTPAGIEVQVSAPDFEVRESLLGGLEQLAARVESERLGVVYTAGAGAGTDEFSGGRRLPQILEERRSRARRGNAPRFEEIAQSTGAPGLAGGSR